MKITITNVYCCKNKGDAAIVDSMLAQITRAIPNTKLIVMSLNPKIDSGNYHNRPIIIPALVPPTEFSKTKVGKAVNLVKHCLQLIKSIIELTFRPQLVNIKMGAPDLIISCGGGFIQSHGLVDLLTNYSTHLVQLYAANKLNIPYIIFAQTIGPLDKTSIRISKNIIENAYAVLVREPISYSFVKEHFPKARNKLTGDIAFLLDSIQPTGCNLSSRERLGITVRKWSFPGSADQEKDMKRYIDAIVGLIEYAVNELNMEVYLMPQCIGPVGDNDVLVSKKIYSTVSCKEKVHVIDYDYEPSQLKGLYGEMNYFVGTRMHSVIFSIAERVPSIAISYDYKTDGIMRLAGLGEFVIPINNIDKDTLINKFNELVSSETVRKTIDERLPTLLEGSIENINVVKEIVYELR